MTGKRFMVVGAIAGVFLLGAMFSPIGEPAANEDVQGLGTSDQVVQTGENTVETPNQETEGYICPNTGEQMNRAGMGMGRGQGMGMGRGQGRGNGAAMGANFSMNMPDLLADALDITVDELQTAASEGKSVANLAEEKGISVEELVAKMVAARKVELEQLVEDGTISQSQMETMLANMETMIKNAVERGMVGPMNGRGGGPGNCMGKGQTNNENIPTNQSL
jgi:hypothetical protein